MKKFKKIGLSFIFLFAFILVVSDADMMQAAATGYTDHGHSWETPSTCGTCGGDHQVSYTCSTSGCSTCGGDGTYYRCVACSAWKSASTAGQSSCPSCGGSTASASTTHTKTKDCTKCWAYGVYKNGIHVYGKNTRCTYCKTNRNGTSGYPYSYAAWSDYPNGVCYTTANTYTQTINHYLWNANTSAWDYWTTTYGSATYATTYTPSYTTTPNGYYNYDITWKTGWTVSGPGTFSAYYYPNTYYVTYDANGGTGTLENQSFLYKSNSNISASEPTRTGYTFLNWWATHTTSTYFAPGDAIPAGWGSFTLQAQWSANSYTITLVPNGGTCVNGAGENVDSVTTTFDTMDFYALSYCIPTRTGYTFKGWYDALEGGTQVYGPDGFCTNEGTYWKDNKWAYADDVTLYAQWEQNEYTVTYDANGGSTPAVTQTYHYGDEIDLSLETVKNGYRFVGWSDTPDAESAISTLTMPDLATSANSDYADDWEMTLYAVYSIEMSDVANHTYPAYEKKKEKEVYLLVWEKDNDKNFEIYPLEYKYDTNKMVYHYVLNKDISAFANGLTSYYYQIIAYDNAGNHSVIKKGQMTNNIPEVDPDVPETPEEIVTAEYLQTTNHYRYDAIRKSWIKFDTSSAMIEEGKIYQPSCITPPSGYRTYQITSPKGTVTLTNNALTSTAVAYTVNGMQTNSAYYKPIDYTLTYNANGGTCSTSKKTISYGDYYGTMPTPTRTGYTFIGWFTATSGGNKVSSSDKYLTAGNTTIYAHWTRNVHTVTYDYWTNGGTNVSFAGKDTGFDLAVDLTPIAQKTGNGLNGWTFVGWNTDPDATTALSSLTMPDEDVTLYAIYKKTITVTVKERTGASSVDTRNLTATIYNNETVADFTVLQKNTWSGWTLLGYTTEAEADAVPLVAVGGRYTTGNNVTLYALYSTKVSLTYNTNGSAMTYDVQSKEVYHNTAGEYIYPTFTILAGPTLSEHSFVNWKVSSGTVTDVTDVAVSTCNPSDVIKLKSNSTLTAHWDAFPEIEAYNRYFTLAQAQNGEITETELLKKVIGTDKEDGTLANGSSVIILNYKASDFTSITTDKEIEITYQATDSFGNIAEKTVTITVTDTTAKKITRKRYIRFISNRFFKDMNGNMISPMDGGLEETSIWRRKSDFYILLEATLNGQVKKKETWIFKYEDIKNLRGSW